ncbi:MAG: ComEC family competence protein [Bacteroidales bacterium]|nr:ComEC family competence protein [Bacteroidales bacterium]
METVKHPFIALFPPFVVGILFAVIFNFYIPYLHFILLFLLIVFVFSENKLFVKNTISFSWLIFPFIFLLGVFIVDYHKVNPPQIINSNSNVYEGVIVEQPKIKDKTVQTIIQIEAVNDSVNWTEFNTKIVVYIQKDSITELLQYGDRLVFLGYLNEITNAGNPKEFNYKSYMANQGVFYASYAQTDKYIVLETNQGRFLKRTALNWRNKLLLIYQKFNIYGQSYGVLSALTLGYRDEVDPETRQMFADTGAMHILAVSGLHVGIIFMILNSLLAFMSKNKFMILLKSVIIILSLWIFAFIAGLSPSVTRSALMFSMFVIGKLLRRSTSIYNIIFASAFILLIINPLDVFAVGFQLSYAAVLSIVFFQPHIYKLFVFERNIPDKIWALLSVSIAAQMGTMPIGFFYFHQFPNYFFLTNVLVIPLASIILYLAVLLLAISWIPVLNGAIAFLLKIALKFLLVGVGGINSLPFAATKNIYITGTQTIVLFIVIISFSLFWIYNHKQLLYSFLVSLLVFFMLDLQLNIRNQTSSEVLLLNTRNSFTMNILSGKNTVIADDAAFGKSNFLDYSCKPYWTSKRNTSYCLSNIDSLQINDTISKNLFVDKVFMQIGNIKMLIVRDNDMFEKLSDKKISVDYVVLSQNVYLTMQEVLELVDFNKAIFDASNKYYRIKNWTEQCDSLSIPYHDVTTMGAFAFDFVSGEEIEF